MLRIATYNPEGALSNPDYAEALLNSLTDQPDDARLDALFLSRACDLDADRPMGDFNRGQLERRFERSAGYGSFRHVYDGNHRQRGRYGSWLLVNLDRCNGWTEGRYVPSLDGNTSVRATLTDPTTGKEVWVAGANFTGLSVVDRYDMAMNLGSELGSGMEQHGGRVILAGLLRTENSLKQPRQSGLGRLIRSRAATPEAARKDKLGGDITATLARMGLVSIAPEHAPAASSDLLYVPSTLEVTEQGIGSSAVATAGGHDDGGAVWAELRVRTSE